MLTLPNRRQQNTVTPTRPPRKSHNVIGKNVDADRLQQQQQPRASFGANKRTAADGDSAVSTTSNKTKQNGERTKTNPDGVLTTSAPSGECKRIDNKDMFNLSNNNNNNNLLPKQQRNDAAVAKTSTAAVESDRPSSRSVQQNNKGTVSRQPPAARQTAADSEATSDQLATGLTVPNGTAKPSVTPGGGSSSSKSSFPPRLSIGRRFHAIVRDRVIFFNQKDRTDSSKTSNSVVAEREREGKLSKKSTKSPKHK